jgi:hypothetical protein
MNVFDRLSMTVMVAMAGALAPTLVGGAPGSMVVTAQQPEREIRRPENLPEPVGQEMRIEAEDLDEVLAEADVVLLDVREPWELEEYGTRAGYINIPLAELESRLDELPTDKPILTA